MNIGRISRRATILASACLLSGFLLAWTGIARGDDPIQLTAEQFEKDFRKNQKQMRAKYKGKTIELTGKAIRVTRHFSGQPLIELMGNNEFSGVLCFTREKEPWGTFAPGQTVKVTGQFPDYPVVPQLDNCTVEAVTKSGIRPVTADALAAECEADPTGTSKKMDKLTLQVTGTITSREFNPKTNFTRVVLKGTDRTQVECLLIPAEKDSGNALKVGDTATIVGQFGSTFENQVHLTSAVVLNDKK